LNAETLAQVLRPIQNVFDPVNYPELLVGLEGPDDAAVWQLDEKRALVVTTDFFTPVVDDPYDYGAIAAANSLSDVYAMGGTPFLALNIAALPPDLPTEISSEILRGGAEKTKEAGVVIAGGHTVQDKEPKYGLVVLGFVEKERMLTKAGLHPSDALVLTKPLGFGCTTTALKREQADDADVREVVDWMTRLNRTAGLLAVEFGLSAATDVTGFSLLGHGLEMAEASGVALHFDYAQIPFVSGARKYAEMWAFPGGASDNRVHFGPQVTFDPSIDEASQMLLFDPQTSGGLLLGLPKEKLAAFKARAQELEQPVWVIGEVREGSGIEVKS
jgi:selenide,water dikinase